MKRFLFVVNLAVLVYMVCYSDQDSRASCALIGVVVGLTLPPAFGWVIRDKKPIEADSLAD